MKKIILTLTCVVSAAAFAAKPKAPAEVKPGLVQAKALVYAGKDAEALPVLKDVAANAKTAAQDRFDALVLAAYLEHKDDMKAFRASIAALRSVSDAAGKEGETAFDADKRFFSSLRMASYALIKTLRDHRAVDASEEIVSLSKEMLKPEVRLDYEVVFVDDLPQSAEAAAKSTVFAEGGFFSGGPLLVNDDRMLSRAIYTPPPAHNSGFNGKKADLWRLKSSGKPYLTHADEPGHEAAFAAGCDAKGLHIYVKTGNPDAWKTAAGLEDRYDWEFSLQPGDRQASHFQYGKSREKGQLVGVEWDTPHPGYRLTQDGIKVQVFTGKAHHYLHIFAPWIQFTRSVPKDGDVWRAVVGAGSKRYRTTGGAAAHELGRGAQLHFKLSKADERKIRLGILRQAVGDFLVKRRQWETADFWDDPHMGDRQFYATAVKPFLADVDAAAKKFVSAEKEPTDEELDELIRTRLPQWAEFTLQVDALREKYLKDALFADGK